MWNLAGMVPGWVPFKFVSDSLAVHSRWLLLLKIEISSIVHCCQLKKFLFFSNSSHLQWRVELSDTILKWNYPRTIPARFGLIWFSGLNLLLWNRWTKLNQTWQGWSLGGSPFKFVSDSLAVHSRWLLLLKIEISSICVVKQETNNIKLWSQSSSKY
jgi:hypothetical protein